MPKSEDKSEKKLKAGVQESKNEGDPSNKAKANKMNYFEPLSRMGEESGKLASGQLGPMKLVLKAMSLKDRGKLAQVSKWHKEQTTNELNTRVPKIQSVVVGSTYTMLLVNTWPDHVKKTEENMKVRLYACGWNCEGQFDLGDIISGKKWTEVTIPEGFEIEKVIDGGWHTFLKGKDVNGEDRLYAGGHSTTGQLGLGNMYRTGFTKVPLPAGFKIEKVICGKYLSFLKGKDESGEIKLYGCGYNPFGQLGLGDRMRIHEFTEVPLPVGFTLEEVVAGYDSTYVRGKDQGGEDELYAAGANYDGQLGLGHVTTRKEFTKVPLPEGFKIEKMIAGQGDILIKGKDESGDVKLYGSGLNWGMELGSGDNENRNYLTEVQLPKGFTVEKVIAGRNHSFLIGKGKDGEDKLYACGSNQYGQLGLGHFDDRHQFTGVNVGVLGLIKEEIRIQDNQTYLDGVDSEGQDKTYACGKDIGYNFQEVSNQQNQCSMTY